MQYEMISADCHVDLCWLPPELFTVNASAGLRDRMPYVTDGPKGSVWVTKTGAMLGLVNGMGSAGREYVPGQIHRSDRMAATGLYDDGKRGIRRLTDPELRLRDQDRDGVQAEVLYGILGTTRRLDDPEAAAEVMRIYNEWLADFCDTHPDRYAGLASIPNQPVEAAVEEVTRILKRGGVRGLDVANSPDMPPLWDPQWAPLWDIVNEARLPVHFHTIGGQRPDFTKLPPVLGRVAHAVHITGFQIHMATILMSLIFGGVLERYGATGRHRRERHRLDPVHPRAHGCGMGGPVQGPRSEPETERVLAPPVQGDLPDGSRRHQAARRDRDRQRHVGLGLPPPRRRLARLPRGHPA